MRTKKRRPVLVSLMSVDLVWMALIAFLILLVALGEIVSGFRAGGYQDA